MINKFESEIRDLLNDEARWAPSERHGASLAFATWLTRLRAAINSAPQGITVLIDPNRRFGGLRDGDQASFEQDLVLTLAEMRTQLATLRPSEVATTPTSETRNKIDTAVKVALITTLGGIIVAYISNGPRMADRDQERDLAVQTESPVSKPNATSRRFGWPFQALPPNGTREEIERDITRLGMKVESYTEKDGMQSFHVDGTYAGYKSQDVYWYSKDGVLEIAKRWVSEGRRQALKDKVFPKSDQTYEQACETMEQNVLNQLRADNSVPSDFAFQQKLSSRRAIDPKSMLELGPCTLFTEGTCLTVGYEDTFDVTSPIPGLRIRFIRQLATADAEDRFGRSYHARARRCEVEFRRQR